MSSSELPLTVAAASGNGSAPVSRRSSSAADADPPPPPVSLPPSSFSSYVAAPVDDVDSSPDSRGAGGGEEEEDELIERSARGLGRRQLCAMLRKNWLVKRRAWAQTFCELLAPVFLTLIILIGHSLSAGSSTETPPTVFANNTLDLAPIINSDMLLALLNDTSSPISAIGERGRDPLRVSELLRNISHFSGPVPVPSFDLFVGTHNLLHDYLTRGNATTLRAVNRLSIADSRFNVLVNLGKLSFAPDTPGVRAVVQQLQRNNLLFNQTFDKIYPSPQDAINFALRDFTYEQQTQAMRRFEW